MKIARFQNAVTVVLPTVVGSQCLKGSEVKSKSPRSSTRRSRFQRLAAVVVLVSLSLTFIAMRRFNQRLDAIALTRTGLADGLEMPTTEEEILSQPTTKPHPSLDWFPPARLFPKGAKLHNDKAVTRGSDFDESVGRDKGIILRLHNFIVPMGLSLIKELRCLGNNELIQVYHCFPTELSLNNQHRILRLDRRVEIIDVCFDLVHAQVFTLDNVTQFQNVWAKPLALHHTNLKHAIVLDVDDFLLRDPAVVRSTPLYKASGTMFFYDRVLEPGAILSGVRSEHGSVPILHYIVDNFDYEAFGLIGPKPSQQLLNSFAYQGETAHEMHSSMVAIDKTRAGKAMDVLWWIITEFRVAHPEFSHGDKESFWLAYELAHVPYAFSPWGASAVSSATNRDMTEHPDTLCGSIAQYIPVTDSSLPELLYVHGRALVDPLTQGVDYQEAPRQVMYNTNASHVVPRQSRKQLQQSEETFPGECLVGLGSTPLPSNFQRMLLRRKLHYFASATDFVTALAVCSFDWEQS